MVSGTPSRRRYILGLMVLLACVAGVVALSAISFLQQASMSGQRARLVEQARSQARLLEAIARDELAEGWGLAEASARALAQVDDALTQYQPSAETGDVQIARRDGDEVVFLVHQRFGEGLPAPLPFNAPRGAPMQRALSGQSGTMIGLDYRGITVLAAYEPVVGLGYGVVAKVDLAEILSPFRRAVWLALGPSLGAIFLGGGLLVALNRPLLRRVHEAESRFEELIQTLGQGFSMLDRGGRLTYVNDELCTMLGYSRQDLLGRPAIDLFALESRELLTQELARRRRGESSAYEVVMVRKDGAHRHVLISARPMRRAGGAHLGSFGILTDITDLRQTMEKLRREKERSQSYFDVAGAVLVVLDADGTIQLINRRGVAVLGYDDASELVAREWFAACVPDDIRDGVRDVFRRIMSGDLLPVETFENEVVRRDGERRLILWHNAALRGADGRICGTLSSGEDITTLRRQGEHLAHLNAILRAIRNVNQLITREKDPSRLLDQACRELIATEGIRQAWIVRVDGARRTIQVAEAGLGSRFERLRRSLLEGQLPTCCRRALDAGATCVMMNPEEECGACPARLGYPETAAVAAPLRHGDKTYGVLVGVVPRAWSEDEEELSLLSEIAGDVAFALHDLEAVEAQREAESALHESEQKYRSLFENAVLGVYLTTPDGQVVAANPVLIAMLGYNSFEDLAARDLESDGYHPDYPRAAFKRSLETHGRVVGLESAWTRKDGSIVYVRENASAIRGADGRIVAYEGTVEDVTARHDAEEARRQMEQHLQQTQRLEAIGTLASGIAHEINNPLTGMINYGQLIMERTDKDSLREFARGVVEEGERVAGIVRNLLTFSRQQQETHSPARIADIVSATLSFLSASLRKDGIAIDVRVPDDLPPVRCRSQQIQQVLLNLLLNARDGLNARYAEPDENKRIDIAAGTMAHDGREWIRLTVEDRGIGISPDVIHRVFDPFFTTKPRDKGTGLGLSISYGIVREHRGTLTVESEPDVRTCFTVELPVDGGHDQTTPGGEERGGRRA